jgi:hypothetical protein
MVGGSQGVHKVLIYSGFNILFFFLHMPKGFYSIAPYFEIGVGIIWATIPIGIVEPTLDASMHFFFV